MLWLESGWYGSNCSIIAYIGLSSPKLALTTATVVRHRCTAAPIRSPTVIAHLITVSDNYVLFCKMPAITIAPTFPIDDSPSSPSGSDSGKHHVISAPIQLPKPTAIPRSPSSTHDHFSVVDLPKLDTFVSLDHLPDVLAVYDKGDITNVRPGGRNTPVYYRRAYPKSERSLTKDPRRAALFLDKANCIESGRRSSVYHAPLFATLGPKGDPRKSVVVAAKVANDTCRSHHLLREEAKGYASFPDQFFNASDPHPWAMGPDTPLVNHRPAMRPRCFPGWGVAMNPKSPAPLVTVPPITPKFYGFYVPLNPETMHSLARRHRECEDFQNSDCDVPNWPKSILLMEDCGEHIDPVTMPSEHRYVIAFPFISSYRG